ncbi:fibronectin type III domain-containing protein [Paenibacillus sp. KR2-11]|uniref:fibronectin type III domain-containing protein n=1 Tax=Paenibacillus sp. KR2-11 TaxID=3385500 RepID=UPI0038FC51CF
MVKFTLNAFPMNQLALLSSRYGIPLPGGGGSTPPPLPSNLEGVEVVLWGNSIFFGQDLTPEQHWINQIAKLNGIKPKIFGYPGQPWSFSGTGTDTSIYSKRTLLPKTGKIYMLYSGGNDPRNNILLGNVDDTAVVNNFSGSFNSAITYIKTNVPGAIIVVVISLPRNGGTGDDGLPIKTDTKNKNGDSLLSFNARAREIAFKHDCYVWDLSGIGVDPLKDMGDGVHPNVKGAAKIKNSGYGFLATIELPGAPTGDTTAPSAPGSLTSLAKTTTTVNLAWTAATDNVGVTGYKVYRNGTLIASPGNVLTYQATGLTQSTAYTFTVRAVDAKGNEGPAATLSVTTSAPAGDTTAPSVPGQPTLVSKTHNSVTISWTASTDPAGGTGVSNYIIEGGVSSVTVGTGTQTTISGLSPDTPYNLTVKARDVAGNISAASPALAVRTNTAPVGGPTVYYENSFNGANGSADGQVAESGQTTDTATAVTPANWTINTNRMKYIGTTGDRILMTTSAASGDYTTEAQIFPAGGKAGVVFRAADGTEYMWVRFDVAGAAGEELKMYKKHETTAANTQIAAGPATINTAGSHIVKVVCAADNVKVFVDGVQAINYTLTADEQAKYGNNTGVGLYAGGENTSTWEYLKAYSNT